MSYRNLNRQWLRYLITAKVKICNHEFNGISNYGMFASNILFSFVLFNKEFMAWNLLPTTDLIDYLWTQISNCCIFGI